MSIAFARDGLIYTTEVNSYGENDIGRLERVYAVASEKVGGVTVIAPANQQGDIEMFDVPVPDIPAGYPWYATYWLPPSVDKAFWTGLEKAAETVGTSEIDLGLEIPEVTGSVLTLVDVGSSTLLYQIEGVPGGAVGSLVPSSLSSYPVQALAVYENGAGVAMEMILEAPADSSDWVTFTGANLTIGATVVALAFNGAGEVVGPGLFSYIFAGISTELLISALSDPVNVSLELLT